MAEIIFHHYALSPFSEKIRRILAFKGLLWRAVDQPLMMPKPDLIALTGGYRRIPVLQIGADVYCDTALIARRLDTLYPGATNPFPWMSEMVDLKKEKNFFETRVIEYQTGGALNWD